MQMPYSSHFVSPSVCPPVCPQIVVHTVVAKVSTLPKPNWCVDYPYGVGVQWHVYLLMWPLTLEIWLCPRDSCGCCVHPQILYMQLWPSYWGYLSQLQCVDYSYGVGVHGLVILLLWLLTLDIWRWPQDSCGHCCVQDFDATMVNVYLWTTYKV